MPNPEQDEAPDQIEAPDRVQTPERVVTPERAETPGRVGTPGRARTPERVEAPEPQNVVVTNSKEFWVFACAIILFSWVTHVVINLAIVTYRKDGIEIRISPHGNFPLEAPNSTLYVLWWVYASLGWIYLLAVMVAINFLFDAWGLLMPTPDSRHLKYFLRSLSAVLAGYTIYWFFKITLAIIGPSVLIRIKGAGPWTVINFGFDEWAMYSTGILVFLYAVFLSLFHMPFRYWSGFEVRESLFRQY
jgi:hypothetical protein